MKPSSPRWGCLRAIDPRRRVSSRVVIGHDMRASSPELAAAFAAGVTGQGLDVVQIGLASTDQLYFASGCWTVRARCSPQTTTRPPTTGSSCAGPAPKPVGQGHRAGRDPRRGHRRVPSFDGPHGTVEDQDVLADYGSSCVRWSISPMCVRFGLPSTRATEWPATPRPRFWVWFRR